MSKKLAVVLAVLGLFLVPTVRAADIVLVNQTYDTDGDGVQDDQGLIDWLVAEGHNVDLQPDIWIELDANDIALLNAADLVIVSRSTNSGDYANDDEATQWNSVATPLIQMSAYLVRSSRWKWIDSTSVTNPVGPVMEAVDASCPVFTYVTLDPNDPNDPNDPAVLLEASDAGVGTGQTSLIGTLDMGNGTLVAKGQGLDAAWIAVWEAGAEFYEGSGEVPAAKRMMFCGGTQEVDATPQGAWNFSDAGAQVFRNAINYMLGGVNIIIVTESRDNDGDDAADDQDLVNWLVDEGHFVDVQAGYWTELDEGKIAELNAADLVIISRSTSSGSYVDDDEETQWNAVTAPIVQSSAYLLRNNRWLWLNSDSAIGQGGAPALEAIDPNHALFADVTLDPNNQVVVLDPNVGSGHTSFVDINEVGNGTLLAKTADGGLAWVAEWEPGVEFYDGAGQSPAGWRMMFCFGTQEVDTSLYGGFNLTADGQQVLSNAIAYLLAKEVDDSSDSGLLAYYPFEEDANDASGNGYDGTLMGDATVVDGVLVLDGDDDAVDLPRLGGDEATFDGLTYSMWIFLTADVSETQFAGGINTNQWGDGAVHFKLNYGTLNVGINGLDDVQGETVVMPGMWSHIAVTVSDAEVALYLDGQLEASLALESPLSGLILGASTLGAWNNGGDIQREMAGLVDDVYIYSRALSQEELIELAGL